MGDNFKAGKILIWFMLLYHGFAGVALLYSGELSIKLASNLLGWTVQGGPELGVVAEILGCFLIGFACMLFVVASDPVKYRAFLSVAIVLIALRVAQRIVFSASTMEVFQISETRYWASTAIVAGLGVLLFLFRRQVGRPAAAY